MLSLIISKSSLLTGLLNYTVHEQKKDTELTTREDGLQIVSNDSMGKDAAIELREDGPEIVSDDLIRKMGIIKRKQRSNLTVEIDDDDHEDIDLCLTNIEVTFKPRKLDRVSLLCKVLSNPQLDCDAGLTFVVKKMEPSTSKQIYGKITYVEPNESGKISDKYTFFWDALDNDYRVVKKNDKVMADCIECESSDGHILWRCLKVVLVEVTTDCHINNNLPPENKDTNKNGIEITDEIEFRFNALHETESLKMMVKNKSDIEYKVLRSVICGNKNISQLELVSPARDAKFVLKPGEEREYVFEVTSKIYGYAAEEFYIQFTGPSGSFKIFRFIKIYVNDINRQHGAIGTGSNVQNNRSHSNELYGRDRTDNIPGVMPVIKPNFVGTKFESWVVPKDVLDIVLNTAASRRSINESLDSQFSFLKDELNASNYCKVFHCLLHLEECEMYHNMRKYDRRLYFTRENEYLSLRLENVADSRPSIVLGDYVEATKPWAPENETKVIYKGWIHEVKHNRILLKFNENFHTNYNNEDYYITFFFSRTGLKKQHHAIELTKRNILPILFPSQIKLIEKQVEVSLDEDSGELRRAELSLPWFNTSLNIVQKRAVANILQGEARPMPYVIFGPPGTGKTVTLIEAILQLIQHVPRSRILVATPSNSSANLITQRIIESGILKCDDFMRLVSENTVQKELIPDELIRYCGTIDIALERTTREKRQVTELGLSRKCNAKNLRTRRLLIGTCITIGTLMQCDFPEGHFSHVIIDESGQCLETEALIPITFVDKQIGQVILAGDPMQLGPIVVSRFAADRGLNKSYLVRILDSDSYKLDSEGLDRYDPRLATKLLYNYRSLPSILNVYSELFYDQDLVAMVKDDDTVESKTLRRLAPILPNFGSRDVTYGVIFHGVEGTGETSTDSPSWLNHAEADKVVQFFNQLIKMGYGAEDIGIITPYKQQVKTIRLLLQDANIVAPKIGSVEEFQGQERNIILVSTVRTAGHQLVFDVKYSLGFVKCPKRMNVAISRARALLVVFGSPKLLYQDANWRFLIEKCIRNKSSINCDQIVNMLNEADRDD